jgi:hypothetical protein
MRKTLILLLLLILFVGIAAALPDATFNTSITVNKTAGGIGVIPQTFIVNDSHSAWVWDFINQIFGVGG